MNDSVIMWPVAVYSIFFSVWIHFQSIQITCIFFSCFGTQMSSGATADLNEQIQKMIFFIVFNDNST